MLQLAPFTICLIVMLFVGFTSRGARPKNSHLRLFPVKRVRAAESIRTSRETLATGLALMEIRRAMIQPLSPSIDAALNRVVELRCDLTSRAKDQRFIAQSLFAELDPEQRRCLEVVVFHIRELRTRPISESSLVCDSSTFFANAIEALIDSLHGTAFHIELSFPELLVALVTETPSQCRDGFLWSRHSAFEWGGFCAIRSTISYLTRADDDLLAA